MRFKAIIDSYKWFPQNKYVVPNHSGVLMQKVTPSGVNRLKIGVLS